VMVRPHRIALREPATTVGADENRLVGVVKRAVFAGDVLHYEVDVGGVTATVEEATRGQNAGVAPGAPAAIVWRVADTLVFPAPP
ncbi:MAG: TOBE domain-containing protein, partial [Methylobacteriaceae bacterium]|nr:TOBE domain-containing protein [Methylobacteriaceae bacterium]